MNRIFLVLLCQIFICNVCYASNGKNDSVDDSEGNKYQQQTYSGYGHDTLKKHASIRIYEGPSTCIACHEKEAEDALHSLHMQWKGPTPELTNTNGEWLGKGYLGINTFCTYAMSSQNTCFSCHVRLDGNAGHAPEVTDVDCLMCHSDVYRRMLVLDPESTIEIEENYNGDPMTYLLGKRDNLDNYVTLPDFDKMPVGITMEEVARTVHRPTRYSCLRCHAAAGGGDWTKRGDMGWSSVNPPFEEDVHLSPDGADLQCVNCHANGDHKIGGRGIDLRQTEAPDPTCQACHSENPHSEQDLNRHATGQVSCQVCHIRTFAKGGPTELSRDWLDPVWNPAFCYGQGGFVGYEEKATAVTPEYVWFDGTSFVYNIGEQIFPDGDGLYHLAAANGEAFDGFSKIVPIKRHWSNLPLHDDTDMIVPPAIMWMFMTGFFDEAVIRGMESMPNMEIDDSYTIVNGDAEMLITHGVDPSERAPRCIECHDNSGQTPDGEGMLPFSSLGFHTFPESVVNCTLCHEQKNLSWTKMHKEHRDEVSCTSCHTEDPTGLINNVCADCHDEEMEWEEESHKKHIEKEITCSQCHTFN